MTLNIAHRGARSLAPENTLAAARKALSVGADLWETDLAITADGKAILFHDDSLARTTDVKTRYPHRSPWTFTNFTLSEIKTLDAGSWFIKSDPFGQIAAGAVSSKEQAKYLGEKIPTLEEGLLFTKKHDWRINLELKRLPPPMGNFSVVDSVLRLVYELKIKKSSIIISSFHHSWLQELKKRDPKIEVAALLGYHESEPLHWNDLNFNAYSVRSNLITEHQVQALSKKGIAVNIFTINEETDMLRFIKSGANGIITDFPQRLSKLQSPSD